VLGTIFLEGSVSLPVAFLLPSPLFAAKASCLLLRTLRLAVAVPP